MSVSPHETFPEEPLLGCIRDKFTEAYDSFMEGESPIDVQMGLAGRVETIALNPKKTATLRDNNRYLAPEDSRPISELEREDVKLMSLLTISDSGEVYNMAGGWLTPEERQQLASYISGCEVSTTVPSWAHRTVE